MEEQNKKSVITEENTNPFPIYPDMDTSISPGEMTDGKVSEQELAQQVDRISPDPNTLDRG